MKAIFTESEKELLRGKIRPLARKYGVSHTYLNMILSGDRELNTELATRIYNGLKETAEFFKPIEK